MDPGRWIAFLGARKEGNWGGTNVLHEPIARQEVAARLNVSSHLFEEEWQLVRRLLLQRRATRIPPLVDDKVLTDWNALAARGLIRAGVLLDEPSWVSAAGHVADSLHEHLMNNGHLYHVWKGGLAR